MLADWIHIDQMHADADVCPGSTYTGRRIYMQEGEARREQLLQMLRDSTAPISGSAVHLVSAVRLLFRILSCCVQ